MTLGKTWAIYAENSFELRGEFFNLFNHTNFGFPGQIDVLRKYVNDPGGSQIRFAGADDMTGNPVPAGVFTFGGKPGIVRRLGTKAATRVAVDEQINFTRKKGNPLPANSSFDWDTTISIPARGKYRMYLQVLGCYGLLRIDGRRITSNGRMTLHGEITQAGQDGVLPTTDGLDNLNAMVELAAGPHQLSVSVVPDTSSNPVQVRLNWVTPEEQQANYAQAIALARQVKTPVVFAWSRSRGGGMVLPGNQDQLIEDSCTTREVDSISVSPLPLPRAHPRIWPLVCTAAPLPVRPRRCRIPWPGHAQLPDQIWSLPN
jgi:beta-glucosidase